MTEKKDRTEYWKERRKKIKAMQESGLVEVKGLVKEKHKERCEAYLKKYGADE